MIVRALILSCLVVGCGGVVRAEGETDAAAEGAADAAPEAMTDVTVATPREGVWHGPTGCAE